MRKTIIDIFFQLLRYSIGASNESPSELSPEKWNDIYKIARQQSLLGVLFYGIQKQIESKPPRDLLLKWYAISERIKEANQKANTACVEVSDFFRTQGFRTCILKGQGNTLNYPHPYIRMSGDIDIWLEGGHDKIMKMIDGLWSGQRQHYHHVEIPNVDGVPVEVHFRPSYMRAPHNNYRMQKWFEQQLGEQMNHRVTLPGCDEEVSVPTWKFNVVFLLQHMYNHLFTEGFGLRQMMDYYFLLKAKNKLIVDNGQLIITLRYLNLEKFAGAVMWVLHEVFGLEEDYYIVPPDEWRGKLLLDEILKGGNFGHYSGLTNHSTGTKYFLKIKRNMRFVRAYPAEALCEPLFRTWHFFWRLFHR